MPTTSKGQRTRTMVVEQAAQLFNRRGYHASSTDEVLRATGLSKGGLYNHFGSKDDLALEAFDHSIRLISERFATTAGSGSAIERLKAMNRTFAGMLDVPAFRGGCPMLNTAVEAHGTNPRLFEAAMKAMTDWQRLIGSVIRDGVNSGEIRPDVDKRAVAGHITALLEGAQLLARLQDDPAHMHRAVEHLDDQLEGLKA